MENRTDLLVKGKIITLDARNPVLEACTVKNGKVQYVGSLSLASKLCDEKTKVLDYGDNYIYPGFIDAHCHGKGAGLRLAYYIDLSDEDTMEGYLKVVKQYIMEHPDFEYYYGAGWNLLDKEPTAKLLDDICPNKAICLNSQDGHMLWLNSKAMEKYGVDKSYVEKYSTNTIKVDDKGNPTGFLCEEPAIPIVKKMNEFSIEKERAALLTWQKFALSQGITAYYEAGADEKLIQLYDSLIKEGLWKLRVRVGIIINENDDYIAKVRETKKLADKYNSEYLKIIGVKIFVDGVVEAHTAWLLEDYADKPGFRGIKRFCDLEKTVELYKECSRLGLNVHAHSIGDAATKFTLDCIEKAQIEMGDMNMRNAIAHLQVVAKDDIVRLANLNVVAVCAPLWMTRYDDSYSKSIKFIGAKRSFYSYPMESFLENNAILAFHSDYPVSPEISISRSIYMACKRNNPREEIYFQLNANEIISRENAISALTEKAAYSLNEDDYLGVLTIDCPANMCVYDKDFLRGNIEEIPDAKLIATIIDGEELYNIDD